MTPSPGRYPKGSSPISVRSSDTCELQADQRDFIRPRSIVPDSQDHIGNQFDEHPAKKFSAAKDEISEGVLGEGFAFAPKQPSRPGQFSERPLGRTSVTKQPKPIEKQDAQLPVAPPGLKRPLFKVQAARQVRPTPLDILEIYVPAERSPLNSTPRRRLDLSLTSPIVDKSSERFEDPVPDIPSRQSSVARPVQSPTNEFTQLTRLPSQIPETQELGLPAMPESTGQKLSSCQRAEPSPARNLRAATSGDVPAFDSTTLVKGSRSSDLPQAVHTSASAVGRSRSSKGWTQSAYFQAPNLPSPRIEGSRSRAPPSSTCGDLEGPVQRSPRERRRTTASRSVPNHDVWEHNRTARNRPQSRTSNISRKRSAVRKPRGKSDADRKKMAMYQVAQYWNECMQIADEEQDYASFKIDALQDSLHRHQSKLSETRLRLEEKKGELRHMETCYQQLQEESGRTAECNKQLEGEIESLQAHILESKGRVTEFENKTRRYRDKINEAITEQQNLWHRSKGFHATSVAEIEKDHQHRMAESKKIEEALGVSRQKRDEMKRCLGELRNNMDQELQTKDKAISDLQCKLMEQEKRLRSENDLAAAVSRQLEAQKSTEKTIAALESKVDSVLANSRKARGELDNDVSYMEEAYKKIEALVQRLEACEVNSLPAAIKQTARRMEKKVEAHVNGALHAASEAHDAAMATLHGTASGLQMELNNISQEMSRRNKAFEDAQVGSNDAQERLHKRLDASQSDLAAMRQQVEGLVNEWAQQSQANISPSETEIDLKKKFDERGDTICFLEQKLQSLAEATSLKMTALAEKALNNGQNAQTELRNVISAFKRSLEQGFKVAQDGSEKSLRHTQTAMAALGGQLRAVSDQLEARFCASDDGDTSGTSQPAVQELTHRLQERIRDLESQVRATASLRERWQHDIRTVDSLKTQLRSIEDRVPQVQDVGSTVERIAEVNRLLHSTAQYLAGERLWVQKHRDHISAQSKAGMVPQEVEQPNQLAADSGESSLIPHIKTSLVLGDVPCLEVPLVRDVTVENSGTKAVHPLAPSIEQEQVRRREGAKPRPILKVSSSQEADEIDAHRNAEIACRTDGRVSFGDTSSLSMATEKMVRDIRNGLLSAESVDSVSSLPTIATFERENPMLDKRWITKAGSKRHRKEPDEMPELMKRVRIVSDLSFTDIDASHG